MIKGLGMEIDSNFIIKNKKRQIYRFMKNR